MGNETEEPAPRRNGTSSGVTPVLVRIPWLLRSPLRLYSGTLVLLVVPMVFVGFVLAVTERDDVLDRSLADKRVAVGLISNAMHVEFDGLTHYVASHADRPRLHVALSNRDVPLLDEILERTHDFAAQFDHVFVTDSRGIVVDDFPRSDDLISANTSTHDWFRGLTRVSSSYVSSVYRRQSLNHADVIAVAAPIRGADAHSSGFLVAEYPASSIAARLAQLMPSDGKRVIILDRKGFVVATNMKGDPPPQHSGASLLESVAQTSNTHRMPDPISGKPCITMSDTVESLGWSVVVLEPERNVNRIWLNYIQHELAAFLVAFLVFTLVGMVALRAFQIYERARDVFHAQLESAMATLEERVHERTRELSAANDSLRSEAEARERSVEALRLSEERYRASLELAPVGIAIHRDGVIRYTNSAMAHLVGMSSAADLIFRNIWDAIPDGYKDLVIQRAAQLDTTGQSLPFIEEKLRRVDGATIDVEIAVAPVLYEGYPSVIAVVRDISERKNAELELRKSEERFHAVAKATNDAVWDWNLHTGQVWWGEGVRTLFGYTPGEADPGSPAWIENIHPDDRDMVINTMQAAVESGKENWSSEYRYGKADGTYARILDRAFVIRDADGIPTRIIGAMMDVTERRNLEEELLRAQKMEAVGRLAGGIAHDFNNLLTIITGNIDYAIDELAPDHTIRPDLEQIRMAADRAAALTRQLLAFARRQVVAPRIIDLANLVRDMEQLVRRLIGEDINLVVGAEGELYHVKADPGQIEQVIINMAANARDAMPEGGDLRILLENIDIDESYAQRRVELEPGSYVQMAISDTGVGMDDATLEQIFEPFFTTKEVGKGTGLGLATCYGIVRQAGGNIWAYSELGEGTTFKIFFPAIDGGEAEHILSRDVPKQKGGHETILVAEDETQVRQMVVRSLEMLGYSVLTAEDGASALHVAQDYKSLIDLLITDVIMPRMGGTQLADEIRTARPGLRILFMSGYAEDRISEDGILSPGIAFLSKPFSPNSLAEKVRSVLDV